MSLFDYLASMRICAREDATFYSLIMGAIRLADTDNLEKLKTAFPDTYNEFVKRYNAPAGLIDDEGTTVTGKIRAIYDPE